MLNKTTPDLRKIVRKGKTYYPESKLMRHAWVRQTVELIRDGRHALQTGGWQRR